jgi:hypothetical protein
MATTLSPLASRLLIGSWLSQLLLAGVIAVVAPIPMRPLVIERRFCSESQQKTMLDRYQALAWRDRLGIERFRPVVVVSVFGQQRIDRLPAARDLGLASSAGNGSHLRATVLQDKLAGALVLRCQEGP